MSPTQRFAEVIADPSTMSVIVQRITDADNPETLKEIARAWQVPLGRLAEWITEDRERAEKYSNALRIAADQAVLDTIRIADSAKPEDVAVRKLQVNARQWLGTKLSRERFGEMNEVRHTGSVSLLTVLSSLRGREIDVTPEGVASALPAPVAPVAETSLEKIPQKIPKLEKEAEHELI